MPATRVTKGLLRAWPLPQHDKDGDKDERGRGLVVGGSAGMPGTMILASQGAFRAGAGKIQIATCRSTAVGIGIAVPETRVFPLAELSSGAIASGSAAEIATIASENNAILIGPGMIDERVTTRLVQSLLSRLDHQTVILDATALASLSDDHRLLHGLRGGSLITPHAGEMAAILGITKEEVEADPLTIARRGAGELRTTVMLKGSVTVVVAPDGRAFRDTSGNIGLAISGSGDTLAGIILGLAARGADPVQAAVWGAYLHGRAGDRLAKRVGPIGYLPEELLAEIPGLMGELA